MSSVLKRTCFYDVVGGTIRPQEWALVNVSNFGPMVEPFWPFEANINVPIDNDDFTSEFQRVDEFVQADEAKLLKTLNAGNVTPWMHGGRHFPREGR